MRHTGVTVIGVCGVLAAASLQAGCGGGGGGRIAVDRDVEALVEPGSTVGGSQARQEPYVEAYAAGSFGLAKSLAESEMRRYGGERAERPALIAGLASHALKEYSEAERLLTPLTSSRDSAIAGRAEAALGLIAVEQKQHEKAVGLLTSASRKLSGDEAARAAMKAGDCLMTLGRQTQARTQYTLAASMAVSPELKKAVADRQDSGNYTVQVGVFNSRVNAQRAVREIQAAAEGLGLQPRIVERTDDRGRPTFVVQVGRFTSRQQAQQAKNRLGTGFMVALGPNE